MELKKRFYPILKIVYEKRFKEIVQIKLVAKVTPKLVDGQVCYNGSQLFIMPLHALVVGVVFVLMKEIMTRTILWFSLLWTNYELMKTTQKQNRNYPHMYKDIWNYEYKEIEASGLTRVQRIFSILFLFS